MVLRKWMVSWMWRIDALPVLVAAATVVVVVVVVPVDLEGATWIVSWSSKMRRAASGRLVDETW